MAHALPLGIFPDSLSDEIPPVNRLSGRQGAGGSGEGAAWRLPAEVAAINCQTPRRGIVQPVEGINNGLLFQPALVDQNRAVQLNTSHPYYHKVYVPNLNRSVTLQGLDSLMQT